MITILIVVGATLFASFMCSLFEAALYSIPLSRIEILRESGVRGGRRLARMREDIEAPIAAILTVNTVAHTAGAAWSGALVGEEFANPAAVGIFAAIFTVLVLALTEIIPKSLGVRYATQIGPLIVMPIQVMIWTTWPVVWASKGIMSWLKGGAGSEGPSEDEVAVLARMAAQHGSVRSEERRWVENALSLNKVTAGELRTPRTVVESLDANTPVQSLVEHIDRWVHSRVPITENDDADKIIGLVHRREVLDAALLNPEADLRLRDLLRPIQFVPESMPANKLLRLFIDERSHMAAVVDEYGGIEGVVTLEDVLERLLGADIVDEYDEIVNMQDHARGRVDSQQGPEEEGAQDKGEKAE